MPEWRKPRKTVACNLLPFAITIGIYVVITIYKYSRCLTLKISKSFTAFVAIIMYIIIARTSVAKTMIILLNDTDFQQNPLR